MNRLPHAQDTIAHWLVVAGLVLLAIVAGIGIGAGSRAGLAAGVLLIIMPACAIALLVVVVLALDAVRAVRRRIYAERLTTGPTETDRPCD